MRISVAPRGKVMEVRMSIIGCTSDSQLRAQAWYDSRNTKSYSLKLNLKTDADIIGWLRKKKSVQGAIKELIREEIRRQED